MRDVRREEGQRRAVEAAPLHRHPEAEGHREHQRGAARADHAPSGSDEQQPEDAEQDQRQREMPKAGRGIGPAPSRNSRRLARIEPKVSSPSGSKAATQQRGGPGVRRGGSRPAAAPPSTPARLRGGEDGDPGEEDQPFVRSWSVGAVPARAARAWSRRRGARRARAPPSRSATSPGASPRRGRRGRSRHRRGDAARAQDRRRRRAPAPRPALRRGSPPSPKPSARQTATSMPMAIATSSGGPVRDMADPADNTCTPAQPRPAGRNSNMAQPECAVTHPTVVLPVPPALILSRCAGDRRTAAETRPADHRLEAIRGTGLPSQTSLPPRTGSQRPSLTSTTSSTMRIDPGRGHTGMSAYSGFMRRGVPPRRGSGTGRSPSGS